MKRKSDCDIPASEARNPSLALILSEIPVIAWMPFSAKKRTKSFQGHVKVKPRFRKQLEKHHTNFSQKLCPESRILLCRAVLATESETGKADYQKKKISHELISSGMSSTNNGINIL